MSEIRQYQRRVNSLEELLALVRQLARNHESYEVQCCGGDGRHLPKQYWVVIRTIIA